MTMEQMRGKQRLSHLKIAMGILVIALILLGGGCYVFSRGSGDNSGYAEVSDYGAISCAKLGLVKDDLKQGQYNTLLLLNAFRDGKKVLVDGPYYLKYEGDPLTDVTVSLAGITTDAEFKLLDEGVIFNFNNKVDVDVQDLKFTQAGTGPSYLFKFASDCLSNKVSIKDNIFLGDIRCIWFGGSTTLNPLVTPFGIKELYFTGNTVEDTRVTFMQISDMPSDRIVVENNTIKNFDYTFISGGIANDGAFKEEMYKAKKVLVVRDNMVSCDNDWWGDPANNSYFCFVLFEGTDCVYRRNTISGLKYYSPGGSGAAVYDSYLSCLNLDYSGNTWENNLSFNNAKDNSSLMKSSGGPPNVNVTRYYENNQYIIEESYIEMCSGKLARQYGIDPAIRLATDKSASWIEFISLTIDCSTYSVLNNTFDIYDMRLNTSSVPVAEMNIEGNIFNCGRISGSLLYFSMYPTGDYTNKTHVIKNNSIVASDAAFSDDKISIVRSENDGDRKYGTILIENNTIMAPCSAVLQGTKARVSVVKGNTVNFVDPSTEGLFSVNSSIDELTVEDNKLI